MSPLFVPTPPVSPGFFPETPLLSPCFYKRSPHAQQPVGYSSTSPKLREKTDIVETPIDTYFDEAENVTENREPAGRIADGGLVSYVSDTYFDEADNAEKTRGVKHQEDAREQSLNHGSKLDKKHGT